MLGAVLPVKHRLNIWRTNGRWSRPLTWSICISVSMEFALNSFCAGVSSWNSTSIFSLSKSIRGGGDFAVWFVISTSSEGGKRVSLRCWSVVLRFFVRNISNEACLLMPSSKSVPFEPEIFLFFELFISSFFCVASLPLPLARVLSKLILSEVCEWNWTRDRLRWHSFSVSSGDNVDITRFASNVLKSFITKTTGLSTITGKMIHLSYKAIWKCQYKIYDFTCQLYQNWL